MNNTNKLPVSVFIITKNEADRVASSINSVIDWVDEVLVIDSGSNDNTIEVAEKCGAKTVFNEWKGFVAQKVFGESICKNNWILNIDADEQVSKELAQEIKEIFAKQSEPKCKAFRLRIKNFHYLDDRIKSYSYENTPIRLYNINYANFNNDKKGLCHDSVLLKENYDQKDVILLKNLIIHKSIRSLSHMLEKANYYTSLQAEELNKKNRKVSKFRIVIEIFSAFFKIYFFRRYFLYGFIGFIDSIVFAFTKFLRLAKLYELQRREDLNKISRGTFYEK